MASSTRSFSRFRHAGLGAAVLLGVVVGAAPGGVIWDDFESGRSGGSGWSGAWTSGTTIGTMPGGSSACSMVPKAEVEYARTFPVLTADVVYVSMLVHGTDLRCFSSEWSGSLRFEIGPTPLMHPTNFAACGISSNRTDASFAVYSEAGTVEAQSGVTYQLVSRISREPNGWYEVALWVDPANEAAPVASSRRFTGGADPDSFVVHQEHISGTSYIDELAIGTSFAEVVHRTGDSRAVETGAGVSAEVLGGSSGNAGGVDVTFDSVSVGAEFEGLFMRLDAAEFQSRFGMDPTTLDLFIPGQTIFEVWDLGFDGGAFDTAAVTVQYQHSDLPAGVDEESLALWHFDEGSGQFDMLPVLAHDPAANTLTVQANGFSDFVLGVPEPGTALLLALGSMAALLRRRKA